MEKYTKFFLAISLFVSVCAFSQPRKEKEVNINKILEKIEKRVDEDIKSIGSWEEVLGIPDILFLTFFNNENPKDNERFEYVITHHEKYKDYIISYLTNNSKKWEYKYYVLGLLQGACIEDYTPIIPIVYKEVRNEILNHINLQKKMEPWTHFPYIDVLYLAIDQDNLSDVVRKNYKNYKLMEIMKTILNDEIIPKEIKTMIKYNISGERAKYVDPDHLPFFQNQIRCCCGVK